MNRRGFTLIELLIVVAIIAILAAIAVPNFLEAQIRSKVARTQNDLRSQATAMEAYCVDWGCFTRDSDSSLDTISQVTGAPYEAYANGITQLTTPVAYITSILKDPFAPPPQGVGAGGGALGYRIGSGSWSYQSPGFNDNQNSYEVFQQVGRKGAFVLIGVGPDGARCRIGYKCFPYMPLIPGVEGPAGADGSDIVKNGQPGQYTDYDPTNGSKSIGDIYRFGGSWQEGRFLHDGVVIGSQMPEGAGMW